MWRKKNLTQASDNSIYCILLRNSICIIFCEVFSTVPFRKQNLWKRSWSCELDNHSVMKAVWNLFLCFFFSILMGFSLLNCHIWTPTPEYLKIVLSTRGEIISIASHRFYERSIMCQPPGRVFGLEGRIVFRDTRHSNSETHLSHFAPDFPLSFAEHLYSHNNFQTKFGYFNYVLLRIKTFNLMADVEHAKICFNHINHHCLLYGYRTAFRKALC